MLSSHIQSNRKKTSLLWGKVIIWLHLSFSFVKIKKLKYKKRKTISPLKRASSGIIWLNFIGESRELASDNQPWWFGNRPRALWDWDVSYFRHIFSPGSPDSCLAVLLPIHIQPSPRSYISPWHEGPNGRSDTFPRCSPSDGATFLHLDESHVFNVWVSTLKTCVPTLASCECAHSHPSISLRGQETFHAACSICSGSNCSVIASLWCVACCYCAAFVNLCALIYTEQDAY